MASVSDVLRLTRAPLAPTAAFDAIACGLLARAPGFSRGGSLDVVAVEPLLALAATSLLVYAAGMAANDLADRKRDETLAPDRPLPSGRMKPFTAIAIVLACAALAVALGGGASGSRIAVVAALALAFAYDAGLKRWPVGGSVAMGSVRFANASIAVLPLVLSGEASPFALLPPLAIGTYSAAITLLSTTEGREAPRRARASRLLAIAAFSGAGVLSVVAAEETALGAFLAFGVVSSLAFGRVPRKGPAKAQVLEMLLGIYFLDAALVSGAGWAPAFLGLGAAFLFIYLSQAAVRALHR